MLHAASQGVSDTILLRLDLGIAAKLDVPRLKDAQAVSGNPAGNRNYHSAAMALGPDPMGLSGSTTSYEYVLMYGTYVMTARGGCE